MDFKDHYAEIAKLAQGKTSGARARKHLSEPGPPDEGDVSAQPSDEDAGPEDGADEETSEQTTVEKRIEVSIIKANDEEQTVSGIVLQPEVVDAHGDVMSADVIKESAYNFLQNFNVSTKLGLQHSTFPKGKMALVESYVAPNGIVLGAKTVKQGSWIMTVKVLDKELWKKVKDGKVTGFSIGGRAKVVPVDD